MLGIGAIEIEEATFSLGMCGHIVVRVNKTNQRYKINHTMSDGWQVSTQEGGRRDWTEPKRMDPEEFIALLPEGRGWTCATFVAAWAGYAAGYERGFYEGTYRKCHRSN